MKPENVFETATSERKTGWLIWVVSLLLLSGTVEPTVSQERSATGTAGLPAWVSEVGARNTPQNSRLFLVNSFGASGNGVKNSTRAIQRTIDACARAGGGI